MEIFVTNETAQLESVVLGIGIDKGAYRGINPMIRKHLVEKTAPTEADICREIKTFEEILCQNNVRIYRPSNLSAVEQIFTRDIGFVIDDYFFVSNMKHPERKPEVKGINYILRSLNRAKIIRIPDNILVEGGDVILWNNYVFVGISDRTTSSAIPFLQDLLPNKKVLGFELAVDQNSPDQNILHLDCTFQPIGTDEAIVYKNGFLNPDNELFDLFPKGKRIEVNLKEKNQMFPNIFSISPEKIVIEKGFRRLRDELKERGYTVFEVDYSETSKLGGLLRCSTLPLKRKYLS